MERRRLNQVTWPPLRGFTKGWLPPSCSRGFSLTHKSTIRPQLTGGRHSQKNTCLSARRGNQEGGRQDARREERCVFLYLFLSLTEAQISPRRELFKSPLRLLFADGWMGRSRHSTLHGEETLCELPARSTVSGHKGTFFFSAPQSNNQKLDPEKGGVFYICVLCVSCRGEHILSLFCFSDLTSHSSSTSTPFRLRPRLRRTVAAATSAKLEKKDTVAWTQNKQCCTDKYI